MQSSKILLKDGQTVDLIDNRIDDSDIETWNNKLNVEISSEDNSVKVTETTDTQTNTKKFDLSVDVDDKIPDPSTSNPLMDGAASVGSSSKYAREDHVHPSDTSKESILNKTTVVMGTSNSKYPTDKAVADFVNSSVATNTANYISNNGEPFTSVEQLEAYTGTVTNNDYAFVTGTDSEGNTYYDRYKATVSGSTVTWALEYRLNNSSFTAAQWSAINSGITSVLVAKIHDHSNKDVLDGITSDKVNSWDGKEDAFEVLPTTKGGTGTNAESITELTSSLINSLSVAIATPVDDDYYVSQHARGGTTNTSYYRRPVWALWEYIKDKISSVLRLTASDYAGKAATAGTADKAVADKSGNDIETTYATKKELSTHTGDTTVHITAEERKAWNAKQSALTFDTTPTAGSTNPVTSDGIKSAIEDSVDQTYSPTSTKAQSGVAVNEAFKTRETSSSGDSYTYLGMNKTQQGTEELYWKLVSFNAVNNYWTLQFEVDVSNGRKGDASFDTEIYETKRLTICGMRPGVVTYAKELRYVAQGIDSNRGYGNNIYYEISSNNLVTVYIKAIDQPNKTQLCRLANVINFGGISNITWYEPTADAGTQPTNPVKFKEVFPSIASTSFNIGSESVPVYVNNGRPRSCNTSNLKAGKDDDGNVIKNTYATKTELDNHTGNNTVHITEDERKKWNGKADKVSGATEGDVATLDANGNLVDSGVNFNPSTNTMSVNISGKASSADSASATTSGSIQANDDLNSYNAANRNYICNADKASTVSNKPSGASGAFELEVIRGTGDTCVQVYYSRDDVNFNYIRKRTGINNAWTDWVKLNDSTHTHTVKINGVTKTISATGGAAVDLGTYLTNHQAVSDSNPTLAWGTTSTVGTVGGKALRVTMPSNPADGMAEDFFALVTQSTFEDVKTAYNAGKRIVGVIGGTTSGNPFRQETPLAFVFFKDNEPFSFVFLFENARPKTASGDGVGSTNRWTLSSSGWATSTDNVDYAEAAGTANMAAKLSAVDTAPKKGSSNMVTSDGLWNDTPSPIAYYFAGNSNSIFGIYNGSRRADEVIVRESKKFRLTTSWFKNFSGRTFKIHNAKSSNLALTAQVEAGMKLTITDEFGSTLQTVDNTSGTSTMETKNPVMSLLPGETLRLYVIYTSGTTDVALFIVGSGRWSVFSPPYDKYRRVESISWSQRLCYAKTTGSPGSKGHVHLYDGKNWHNLCNITDDPGIVRIGGLDSSRTSSNPATSTDFDGYMNIVTGLTLTRNGYMGMLHGYVAPKQSVAFRLPTASSDTATSYTQSGKTLANCSELRIDGFDKDAIGAGHAVFTASSLLHITLLSGTLTFAIAGDFSVFTTGASYFFSIPLSFGNLNG